MDTDIILIDLKHKFWDLIGSNHLYPTILFLWERIKALKPNCYVPLRQKARGKRFRKSLGIEGVREYRRVYQSFITPYLGTSLYFWVSTSMLITGTIYYKKRTSLTRTPHDSSNNKVNVFGIEEGKISFPSADE